MNNMRTNYLKIYEQLGYLFYALASADKRLRKIEFEILKKDVEREWIPLESSTDEYGTDAANYIYFTYDSLLEQDLPPMEAFNSFCEYFRQHAGAFDDEVRRKIKTTAEHMSKAVGNNHTEAYMIKELKKLLKTKHAEYGNV